MLMPIGTISDTTWNGVSTLKRESLLSSSSGFSFGMLLKTINIVLLGLGWR
jgi:hypothetical protein